MVDLDQNKMRKRLQAALRENGELRKRTEELEAKLDASDRKHFGVLMELGRLRSRLGLPKKEGQTDAEPDGD